jgi:hypothetical protein
MKIIIDTGEARRFAALLDQRTRDLKELNRRVSHQIMELGMNGWQDSRYRDFLRRFDEVSTFLQVFLEHTEKYAHYLRRKAVAIDRYLDRR